MGGDILIEKYRNIILIVILITIGLGFFSYYLLENQPGGITAMEGKIISDNVATAWNEDAILTQVGSVGTERAGRASGWIYTYYSPSTEQLMDDGMKYERAQILVYSNQTTLEDYAIRYSDEIGEPIEDWNVDSPQAYDIAIDSAEISTFLHKYRNSDIASSIRVRQAYANTTVWHISWQDWGVMDNPHNAEIYIDANTGEVLYVRADD